MDNLNTYIVPRAISQPQLAEHAKRSEAREAAEKFESMFVAEMMKPLFESVGSEDPIFGGGHAEKMFQSMMIEEYGQKISEQGGFGIADKIEAQLLQLQEIE